MATIPTAEESATILMTALVEELKLRPEDALLQLTPITLSFEKVGGNRRDLGLATSGCAVSKGWLREEDEKDGALFLTAAGYQRG